MQITNDQTKRQLLTVTIIIGCIGCIDATVGSSSLQPNDAGRLTPVVPISGIESITGGVMSGGDDDTNELISMPTDECVVERCDGLDNDCDERVDEEH